MQLHSTNTLHRARKATTHLTGAYPSFIRGVRASPWAASSRQPLQIFPCPKLGPAQSTDVVQALPTAVDALVDNLQDLTGTKSVRIYYSRRDKRYQNWGLHVWGDAKEQTDWQRPLQPVGFNQEGVWFDVPLKSGATFLGVQIHHGDSKAARAEVQLADLKDSSDIWLVNDEQYAFLGQAPSTANLPVGSLAKHAATWASANIILWRHEISDVNGLRKFFLHGNSQGHLWVNGEGVQGSESVFELKPLSGALPTDLAEKYPYLKGCSALLVPPTALDMVPTLIRGQLAMSVTDANGVVLDATGVQLQGALDAYYKYDGPLGTWRDPKTQRLMVSVWAPTAQNVELLHFKQARGGDATVLPMARGALGPGVWSTELPNDALWTYYKYRLNVYHPESRKFEVSEAPDPYSRSLAANAERTQIVLPDLDDPRLAFEGWQAHASPVIARWTDISLYELCIRDFSSQDQTVKPELRGKYLAFVPDEAALTPNGTTAGLVHLASLREAGMNHLHLLPTYDFGSVPERAEDQMRVTDDLSKYAPDGEEQQRAVLAVADQDAFNWGYDPVLFGVPDGSYATDPDGEPRITEFRRMVMSLHQQGWRVVLDVVYNHLFAAGPQSNCSVLDKVVPGYYTRKYEDGSPCLATCGHSVASEFYMCERLVVDDIAHWAQHYKIDGFRFDLMGHILVSTMEKIRARLDTLTPEKHGVDGKSIYLYGEAWDFGEVVDNARGINSAQRNLAGTRIGSFNDRIRDAAMGGGPYGGHDFQGFVTGLGLAPGTCTGQGDIAAQLHELAQITDWIQFALAGNLRQYKLQMANGETLTGEAAVVNGTPLGYGKHPCEHISYIGCHDNMTMFDLITEKAALTALADERVRMQVMAISLILMSQGIPFIHAGDDILRSKSLDRDSYNSGDWFNGVDWTAETHKLGIGLPVHTKNGEGWHYKRPLLTNPMIKPSPNMLKNTAAITQQLLRMRYSSPLFRLPSAEAVCNQVFFHNTGPKSIPGVIVMELVSAGPEAQNRDLPFGSVDGTDVPAVYDPDYERIVVVFNASPLEKDVAYPPYAGSLKLHPLQSSPDAPDARARTSTADDNARQLTVPARTAAVFVQPR